MPDFRFLNCCAEPRQNGYRQSVLLTFADLVKYRGEVVMVDGAFDPIHAGHIDYFRQARALGRSLLCNLAADGYIATKHPVLLPSAHRVAVVDALRDITYTHLSTHSTDSVLSQLRPYAYVKGLDWKDLLPPEQVETCRRFGIRIVFVETVTESSTRLLRAVRDAPPALPTSAVPLATSHPGS